MKRPVIGITGHFDDLDTHSKFTKYFDNCSEAIRKAGGIPYLLPISSNNKEIRFHLKKIDGLFLRGGGGLSRIIKNKKFLPELKDINPERYKFEKKLIFLAKKMNLPMIGLCRGHQMITEIFGGSLRNLTKEEVKVHYQKKPGYCSVHNITLNKKSKLYRLLKQENLKVNSFHRQITNQVPKGFIVSSYHENKIIESIEHKNKPIISLQFHPEKQLDTRESILIFKYFIRLCRKYSGYRKKWNRLVL